MIADLSLVFSSFEKQQIWIIRIGMIQLAHAKHMSDRPEGSAEGVLTVSKLPMVDNYNLIRSKLRYGYRNSKKKYKEHNKNNKKDNIGS